MKKISFFILLGLISLFNCNDTKPYNGLLPNIKTLSTKKVKDIKNRIKTFYKEELENINNKKTLITIILDKVCNEERSNVSSFPSCDFDFYCCPPCNYSFYLDLLNEAILWLGEDPKEKQSKLFLNLKIIIDIAENTIELQRISSYRCPKWNEESYHSDYTVNQIRPATYIKY